MRCLDFSFRNLKEMLRDPLGYIFCLGFPLVMLVLMTLINESIPPQSGMTLFQLANLAPGIAVFGITFMMLFASLSVAQDRGSAFLLRLYVSPMKGIDFILGYTLPYLLLSVIQVLITYLAALVIGAILDVSLSLSGLLLSVLGLLPTVFLLIGLGLMFGSLFSEKASPGICSIFIAAVGILGGIWMDVQNIGGILKKICLVLPFYHSV
ncbi:MAG: ABC transporter permease, partial [Bacillota bacterium]|nr:ABC transporter permease [Bacillota bacterium]